MRVEMGSKEYQKAYSDGYISAAESAIWGLLGYVTSELNLAQTESLIKTINEQFNLILKTKKDEVEQCLPLL